MSAITSRLSPVALGTYRGTTRVRDKLFSLAVSGAFRSYGRRSVIQLPARLSGERHIVIGDDVFIGTASWLQVIGDDPDRLLTIGDGTSVSGHTVLSAARSLTLGRKVLIARGVYIADHGHGMADTTRAVLDQGLADVAPVSVGDGAWLGENVVICPGVRVGANAVVGANSVVTRDIPDASVAVGAPARVIRSLRAA